MINLDIAKIREITGDLNVLNAGFRLYQKKDYNNLKIYDGKDYDNSLIFEASFNDGAETKLITSPNSIIGECSCQKGDYCQHQVALMFVVKDNNYERTKANFDPKSVMHDQMQEAFTGLENALIKNYDVSSATLDLLLREEGGIFYASFKIGRSKKYIITNLEELVNNYKIKKAFSFGKEFKTSFNNNEFDEKGLMFINFIIENYIGESKKEIKLDYIKLHFLLSFYLNNDIEVLLSGLTQKYLVVKKDPQIKFYYENDVFGVDTQKFINFYHNNQTSILFYEDKIWLVSALFTNKYASILHLLQNNKFTLIIDKEVKGAFLSKVYPNLFTSYFDEYNKLYIKTYLDYVDNKLLLEYHFDYYNSEGIKTDSIIDRVKERNYLNLIYHLGFKDENDYTLDGKNNIYTFLDKKVQLLKEYGDVFLSENLHKMPVRRLKQFKINFGITNNLLDINFENLELSPYELEGAIKAFKSHEHYFKLGNNTVINLDDESFVNLSNLVDELNLDVKKGFVQQLPLYKAFNIDQSYKNFVFSNKIFDFFKDIAQYKESKLEISSPLKDILRDYQIEAVKWLHIIAKYNLGGLLADDMGLGKTLEIISLLELDPISEPSLIISPTSLIYNWQQEIHKFSNKLECEIISGMASEREEVIRQIQQGYKKIFIISYDSFLNDCEKFYDFKFRFLILDEAQYIKNQFAKKTLAVKNLQAHVRYALTGTPIENSLTDLWSIFDFILPGYLPDLKTFKDLYEDQLDTSYLKKKISLFILRRLKKDVLTTLKEKIIIPSYAILSKEERKLYEWYLVKVKEELKEAINKSFFALTALMHLRQIACHPRLFIKDYQGSSAKLELAIEIIKEYILDGHKVLLFSSFTSMLDLISDRLQYEDIKHYMLTGKTSSKDRLEMANNFNHNDVSVFLISLKAGGTGLNLTSADVVIHFDPWWNLAAENQATDRSYRMGQTNEVKVIKLIAKNTVEEKIINLQEHKRKLMDFVGDDKEFIKNLTQKEVLELFKD